MIDMSENKMSFDEMANEISKSINNRILETTDILLKKNKQWGIFRVYADK